MILHRWIFRLGDFLEGTYYLPNWLSKHTCCIGDCIVTFYVNLPEDDLLFIYLTTHNKQL